MEVDTLTGFILLAPIYLGAALLCLLPIWRTAPTGASDPDSPEGRRERLEAAMREVPDE